MPENNCKMEFIPLHFGDKLHIVNPKGRIGVITLWSKIDYVLKAFDDAGINLDSSKSEIVAVGNLFGNGIPHLLRNLLYNPQIREIIICGSNRSGSAEELLSFFVNGLEETIKLGETVYQIKNTNRTIDNLVLPENFTEKPRITIFGEITDKNTLTSIKDYINNLKFSEIQTSERINIELPKVEVSCFPSEPRSHNITKEKPLDAWRELIFRLVRFGHLVQLRKGARQELQNVKVVITNPQLDDAKKLADFNISLDSLIQYQKDMLSAPLPVDHSYTYGNRIRQYYGFDSLDKFAERLKSNPQDRDCYLSLWDSRHDINAEDSPCLVSLFFRVYDEKLTLTATYRTHNALDAWLKNVYGLMKAQQVVSEKTGIPTGAITVMSHSISVDPSKYEDAKRICNAKGFSIDFDHNGQFTFSVKNCEIVACHMDDNGTILHEYRSKKAERIQHEIARDCAISDINHAIYIGRQLARAQHCLDNSLTFEEE